MTVTQVLMELEKSCDKILNVKFPNGSKLHDAIFEAIEPICKKYKLNLTTWAINLGPDSGEDVMFWETKVFEYINSEIWRDKRSSYQAAQKLTKAVFSVPESMKGISGNMDLETYRTALKCKAVESLLEQQSERVKELNTELTKAVVRRADLIGLHIRLFNSLNDEAIKNSQS